MTYNEPPPGQWPQGQPPGGYPPPGQPGPGPQGPPPQGPPAGSFGAGQPPGAWQQPPVQKRRRWPWILLAVFLGLALLIGGCSLFVYRVASAPIGAANDWLALVDEGRYGEAYDSMCTSTQSANTRSDVEAALARDFGAGIDDYSITSYNNTNGVVTVSGTVTTDGRIRNVTFDMADNDGWKVCEYSSG